MKLLITTILSLLIIYIGMSFIELTINFIEWDYYIRMLFVLWLFIIGLYVLSNIKQ